MLDKTDKNNVGGARRKKLRISVELFAQYFLKFGEELLNIYLRQHLLSCIILEKGFGNSCNGGA